MQRRLLALFLSRPDVPLDADTLAEQVWQGRPPRTSRKTIAVYVHRLRRAVGCAELVAFGPAGYTFVADAVNVDAVRFDRLAQHVAHGEQPLSDMIAEALGLWRGEPFQGFHDMPAAEHAAHRLSEIRAGLLEQHFELAIEAGEHADICPAIKEAIAEYPYREKLHADLMLALYRSDRRAEALEAYRQTYRLFTADLGVEPMPELQRLHAQILTCDRSLAAPASLAQDSIGRSASLSEMDDGAAVATAPAQLPPDLRSFVGREAELAALDHPLAGDGQRPATAIVISAIAGTAGIGKTTLAVRWAHRIRDRFPDGQLFVNLHGSDPTGMPTDPADALRGFLTALGVPPERVPATVDARTALYRTTLASKRVLVILDNALDADQVRPLLPGAPGCLVVVTSRDQLAGLAATEGAEPITLELLRPCDSRELVAKRVGQRRAAAEPAAIDRIADLCAGLPLALAIVAARAGSHPHHPLEALADQLESPHARLDALNAGDAVSDVREVFSWSYRSLSDEAARLFRLLALYPGPDIALPAAASLAGVPVAQARALLAELSRAHLISAHRPDRFEFHDLLRLYAIELDDRDTPGEQRRAALGRVMDHYLAAADAAATLLHPGRPAITDAPVPDGMVARIHLPTLDDAMAWFAAERQVLLAAVRVSAMWELHTHAWQLAWNLRDILDRNRLFSEQVTIQHVGLDSAQRIGNRCAEAHTHRSLGRAYGELGQHEAAREHYGHAYGLFSALGDHLGQARIHLSLGTLTARSADMRTSLDHHVQALALFERAGDRAGRGNALNNIAMNHLELGEHEQALRRCVEALELVRADGDAWAEASTLATLGEIHLALGHPTTAVDRFEEAATLLRRLGDRFHQALILSHLASAHEARGDAAAADDSLDLAIGILDDIDHPEARRLRARRAATVAG
jgi:DNA-binding SARP family transcriptional activator/tetratricopeptide (TPR) repeat protein